MVAEDGGRTTILVVDDDAELCRALKSVLSDQGFDVALAADGASALEECGRADLIVLDIMLPGMDGFEVCEAIRARSAVPIIMLTAKGDIVDKRVGFGLGADDYMVKPFSSAELLLRIEAVLRRAGHAAAASQQKQVDRVVAGNLEIDRQSRTVRVDGEDVYLTAGEFDLLWFLASNPNQVFTRRQIFSELWGECCEEEPKTITVLVRKIREKIERDAGRPTFVRTVWGVGYKFSR